MSKMFYYKVLGEVSGPVSEDVLRLLAKSGRITKDTYIQNDGGSWYTADRIPELWEETFQDKLNNAANLSSRPRTGSIGKPAVINVSKSERNADKVNPEKMREQQNLAKYQPIGIGGRIGGLFLGTGCSIWLFFIFWPIGIVILLASLVFPFMPNMGQYKGNCPYCETEISMNASKKGVTCPGCKRRSVLRGDYFIRVD
jgi:GYF domain 2